MWNLRRVAGGLVGLAVLGASGCGDEREGSASGPAAGSLASGGEAGGKEGPGGGPGMSGSSGHAGGVAGAAPGVGAGGAGGQGAAGVGAAGVGVAGGGVAGALAGSAYDGQGFVVHEWGTNTVVVGSDGSMQRGLHHEEEDLPGFVYDRVKAGALEGSTSVVSVDGKMETPVTYFYSPVALEAKVAVEFPQGVLTQWYPAVSSFYPPVFRGYWSEPVRDPVLETGFGFTSSECKAQHGAVGNGLLDWGTVSVLAPGQAPALPEAPLDATTWSLARQVAANSLRVAGVPGATGQGQSEKFLFYRGLGNLSLPVRVTAGHDGAVTMANEGVEAMAAAFVVRVGAAGGSFVRVDGGLGAGASRAVAALPPEAPLDEYAARLGEQVTSALDATGLFHDEAVAMVNTWSRQWFRTPGLRAFYLVPPSFVDAQIPLTISPKPDKITRVMMIRVEVITPAEEAGDADAVGLIGGPYSAEGEAHFKALGRFAEPRLRRAIALTGLAADQGPLGVFLGQVTSADTRAMAGE